jgi:class 3 adenylate cyclase/tetratricopeptide (TPR) repeat protein
MDDFRGRANERRQLTVLFCDIVDSTGLSERCDPEDLSEILQEFQRISTRCINDAGGTVINYIGDGIRSQFGYPLASENEAASAVRAGLSLLNAIEQLGARSTATIQEPLLVRIGVHTGFAVIGKAALGHVHDATEIVGDTPNIAFRLQEIGAPNSLVISGETQRLLKRKFQLRPLGLHSLKGLSRKVEAFQVLGELMEDHAGHHEYLRDALPLVGRSAEIDQLQQAWALAKTGRGHTVEITGEAGIGKSRLAMELISKAELDNASIVVLQASAHHQNTPFYPIVRRFEQMIGVRKEDSVETSEARLREFLAQMPSCYDEQHALVSQLLGLPTPRPMTAIVPDAQELRRKTREVVVQLLTMHSPGSARLILVEDLHWADPSTVEVIERIGAQIANVPILLVSTSRTASIRSNSGKVCRMPLQRLADDDCRILAGSVVRKQQLSRQLLEQIVTRSDGVPLFVEELTAAAVETGQVDTDAGANVVAGAHGVPSALYDSLMLRLERLGKAKAIAQVASVIGRSFSHHLLAQVAAELGDAFEVSLERLIQSGLIRLEENDDEKVYSFKHALVRDVAYHSLLKRQRRELHARVADTIELYLPELADREPDYLAQHLSEAERTSRAVHMWLKAANTSAERSANLEALAQLGMALEQIKKLPAGFERDSLELNAQIARIGPTIALQGFAARAVAEVSSRAIDLCHALDDDPRIFPALYARWSYLRVDGNVREAGALAQEFLTLAEKKGARADRMVGHRLLGTSLLDGETERAREHLEKAIKLYDGSTDRVTAVIYGTDVQVTSLSNLCIVDWLLGRASEAVKHGRGALELAAQLQHAHTLGYAFAHVCMLHTLERDIQAVETLAQHALAGATRRELPLWISVARTFLGWSQVQSGAVAEGIDTLEKQRNFLHTAHLIYWLPTYLCWLAEAYIETGQLKEARLCVEQARDVIGRGGNYWYEGECLRIEGCLKCHSQIDDAVSGERCLQQALALARQRGHRGFALRATHSLAGHLVGTGRPDAARKLMHEELVFFADQPDRGDRARARAFLSSLQNRTGT